ncbi:MAG: DUF1549 domain-containing protein [Planctomycetota bacterium]|nr:MAG: DUF1549 domain-containing protein [Planctomycetota bacterium]
MITRLSSEAAGVYRRRPQARPRPAGWMFWGVAAMAALAAFAPYVKAAAPQEVAAQVDAAIEGELKAAGLKPAPLCPDEDYLRRVTFDIAGRPPSPQELLLFLVDPSEDKRSRVVEELLGTEDYALNWARYWRDVLLSHATNERAPAARDAFVDWMARKLRENRPWDEIATELITATGEVREDGATMLIFAQQAEPAEVAAEVARVFLGIQIQCANCHDHPTDSWTRRQFHQLAAFFPRITLRRDPDNPGNFVVASFNMQRRRFPFAQNPERVLIFLDRNRDGKLSKQEVERTPLGRLFDRVLQLGDKDGDGQLSLQELKTLPRPQNNQPGRGALEHYMPDLQHPEQEGTLMTPVFFLDTSVRLRTGTDDLTRRRAVAKAITSPRNEWFAKAFVNRMWAAFTGQGFYVPIDDIGPERTPQHPQALEILAQEFTRSGYDIQWLIRTITATRAYQRQARSPDPSASVGMAAVTPARLRADQIYSALVNVFGLPSGGFPRRRPGARPGRPRSPRDGFSLLFGIDPSTPPEDVMGTIPQALFMMNSPLVNGAIRAFARVRLPQMVREARTRTDVIRDLYLLVLNREPTDRELEIITAYVRQSENRLEAFEDVLWALINSTEFISKR